MNSMMGPAIRMLLSLGVVLGLMYVAAMLLRRTHGGASIRAASGGSNKRPARRGRSTPIRSTVGSLAASFVGGRNARATQGTEGGESRRTRRPRTARRRNRLEVLARQPLGKTASVAVVRVAGRTLLVGVTDTAVQLLSEVDSSAFEEPDFATDTAPTNMTAATIASADVLAELTIPDVEPTFAAIGTPSNSPAFSVLDLLRERTVRRA